MIYGRIKNLNAKTGRHEVLFRATYPESQNHSVTLQVDIPLDLSGFALNKYDNLFLQLLNSRSTKKAAKRNVLRLTIFMGSEN